MQRRFLQAAVPFHGAYIRSFRVYVRKVGEEALIHVAPNASHIVVEDIRHAMALTASFTYNHPDRSLNVIGITGTKGKSTTAYMLRSILDAANMPSSILGSIETDDGLVRHESHNTTPEAPDLWRHLHNTKESGEKSWSWRYPATV